MYNLFDLHDPLDDKNVRQLLRVYGLSPKYSRIKEGAKAEQGIKVVSFLQEVNKRLMPINSNWKKEWIDSTGYSFSSTSFKDWFIGRASVPLICIEKLKLFGLENEVNNLMKEVQYVSSCTQEIVKVPKIINPDLVYLCGLILGDGSLPISHRKNEGNLSYRVGVHSGDKEFLSIVEPMIVLNFETQNCCIRKDRSKNCWTLSKSNKIIFRFFYKIMGIPNGKKSHKAIVPDSIKILPPKDAIPFIAGLVDSDIGKHSHGMGSTFRSKEFVVDLVELLSKLGVNAKVGTTNYLHNKYYQHDFRIPKSEVGKFKEVLSERYLPYRKDRLDTINALAGVR